MKNRFWKGVVLTLGMFTIFKNLIIYHIVKRLICKKKLNSACKYLTYFQQN